MKTKQILILCSSIFLCSPIVFAETYTSPNYTLSNARIVISGGEAGSSMYSLSDVEIGQAFGGKAESSNYSFDASSSYKKIPPAPPIVNDVISPTNNPLQTLSGTKERYASIYINGNEKVSLDTDLTWNCDVTLQFEGENSLFITTRNIYDLESAPVNIAITLDTIPPVIAIDPSLDGTMDYYADSITIRGTVDGVEFSEEVSLNFGLNTVTIERTDEAGNTTHESMEVYRLREPIALPEV